MLARTSHSALLLPNKAPEGTGMSAQEHTEKSSKQIHKPPSKMHENTSSTLAVEFFAGKKSHTRLSSLEGLFGYNFYTWFL